MHDIAVCLQSRKLSDIVIPGSHDSATYGFAPGQGLDLATTQDEDLKAQLNDGMRKFDIRVEYTNGASGLDYYAHHGSGITDQISHWLTLTRMFKDISEWAHEPGHEHEIILLSLTMDPPTGTYNENDCGVFGAQMGGDLLSPDNLKSLAGTTDPGQLTLGQLWSLPVGDGGTALVIMDNIPCLVKAGVESPGGAQWGPFSPAGQTLYSGYYADQCTAYGISRVVYPNTNQYLGISNMVGTAAYFRNTVGSGGGLPNPLGPPKVGGLYELDIQGTPEAAPPSGPSIPSCLVTPLSMLPDENEVLNDLNFGGNPGSPVAPSIIAGDFVEATGLFNDAMAWDQQPLAPAAPEITGVTNGAGQVTVAFSDKSYGTDPITSYTVTATDQTNPAGSRTASGDSSPVAMKGLIIGDMYDITVTATNINGTSPPSAPSAITSGVSPTFVSGPAANADFGAPYASGFAVTGAPPPTVMHIHGELPPGLTLQGNGNTDRQPLQGRKLHVHRAGHQPAGFR